MKSHLLESAPELEAKIPPLILDGIQQFVVSRVKTGSFLLAVLENNLASAICRADPQSLAALREIVWYVHNCIPGNCHGSPQKVADWLRGGPQYRSTADLARNDPVEYARIMFAESRMA